VLGIWLLPAPDVLPVFIMRDDRRQHVRIMRRQVFQRRILSVDKAPTRAKITW
jgi:hypothetical protein